jgi:GDPmannose 4,6-dehydratase
MENNWRNMSTKKALITGITGQVGSHLADFLLALGYEVHGTDRRKSVSNYDNIKHIITKIKLHESEITDPVSMDALIKDEQFDEIYNMAAQSHVLTSFTQPNVTFQINTIGVLNILEAIRKYSPHTRLYQASTSEMFGKSLPPQNEKTALIPASPYGCAKLAAHHLVRNYRESYGMHVQSGIMFNTDGPRRGKKFLTRKITEWVKGWRNTYYSSDYTPIRLGNLTAKRDWLHPNDSCRAIYRICNQVDTNNNWNKKANPNKVEDYTFGSGIAYSVKEFLQRALELEFKTNFDTRFEFNGEGKNEILLDKFNKSVIMIIDKEYFRPNEVDYLQCDYTKIKTDLSWNPESTLDDIIRDMLK